MKLGKLRFALFAFVLLIAASFFIIQNPLSTQAASSTFKQETDPQELARSIKFFGALTYCSEDFKTKISGGDIDKGPRWWVDAGKSISLGKTFDTYGSRDGRTACNGESDEEPGWIEDAFSKFGASGKSIETLQKLGYTCKLVNNSYECSNDNAKASASTTGSVLNKLLNMSYFGGTDPLKTSSEAYKAMTYYAALQDLKTLCSAKKGGSANVFTVKTLQGSSGTIVTEQWGAERASVDTRESSVPLEKAISTELYPNCKTFAKETVDNITAWQSWTGAVACKGAYPDKASNDYFIQGCTVGWSNPTDYHKCVSTTFNGISAANTAIQRACAQGQGVPTAQDGKTASELCYSMGYESSGELNACTKGAINRDDAQFCHVSYAVSYSSGVDTSATNREACLEGQKLVVTDSALPSGEPLADEGEEGEEETGISCPVEGIGWMICPLLNAIGGVSDAMLGWVSSILTLEPLELPIAGGDTSAQYTAWNSVRNIANVVLVIGFIFIIFSQLTGVGVSNYGVKKTLPRLIIVAILINLSFYVMAIAVDVTNILGQSIDELFKAATPDFKAEDFNIGNVVSSFLTGTAFTIGAASITAAALVTSGIPLSGLVLMAFPIVLTAALALFAAFATLFIRNALIVVLVVISPLAIAAYLLPNTQQLFTKWRKLFVSMLMLFPMAALLFAGAKFAAYVTAVDNQPLSALAAIFLMAAPLGMLPFLIRSSNSLLGAIGGKLGGLARSARNPLRKAVDSRLERAKAGYRAGDRTFFGRRQRPGRTNMAQRSYNKRMARDQETKNLQGAAEENWRESGLTGTGRTADRTRRALDAEKTLGTRKAATDAAYTARSDKRRATAGTQDNLYTVRAENSALESEAHRSELERARTQRVATTPNLAELDTRMRAAKLETTRNEAGLKARFDQQAQESGALSAVVQQTKAAEETSKTIQMEQDTAFQQGMNSDPTLLDLRNRQAASTLETATLKAEGAAETDRLAAEDPGLKIIQDRKADAELRSAGVAASVDAETVIRQNSDNELKNIKLGTEADKKTKAVADAQFGQVVAEASTEAGRDKLITDGYEGATLDVLQATQQAASVTASATDSAQRIQQKEYATELKNTPSLAERAGGIDDPYGASRVTAAASSLLTDTVTKAIASERSTMTTIPTTTETPGEPSLMGIVTDSIGTPQTPERRAAAVAQVLKVGGDGDIHALLDYVQDPANFTNNEDRVLMQQQVASDLGSRKPTSIGASDVAALARGEYEGEFDKKVASRISGGKVSADTLASTSADELKRIRDVINRGGIDANDPHLVKLRKQIGAFFKNETTKLPPPEIVELMEDIQGPEPQPESGS